MSDPSYEQMREVTNQRAFELVTARLHHDEELELDCLDRITLLAPDEQHRIIAVLANLAASCFEAIQTEQGNDVIERWQTFSARIAERIADGD